MEQFHLWLSGAAILLSGGGTFYAWMTARSKVNSEHLKHHDDKLTEHDRRIQKLENEIEHLPTKDSQHEQEKAILEMAGNVKLMSEQITGLRGAVRRIENYFDKVKEAQD